MLTNPYSEYSIQIMSLICGIQPQTLRHWTRQGLLKPIKREHARRGAPMIFSFTELLKARVISRLRHENISLQRIRRALEALERFSLDSSDLFLIVSGDDIWAETDKDELVSLVKNCGQLLLINIAYQRAEVEAELKVLWAGNDRGETDDANA